MERKIDETNRIERARHGAVDALQVHVFVAHHDRVDNVLDENDALVLTIAVLARSNEHRVTAFVALDVEFARLD